MSPFSLQGQNLCGLSLVFIKDGRVVFPCHSNLYPSKVLFCSEATDLSYLPAHRPVKRTMFVSSGASVTGGPGIVTSREAGEATRTQQEPSPRLDTCQERKVDKDLIF